MALFRRKPTVPEWASFMTAEDYARFLALVERAMAERGIRGEITDGIVRAPEGDYRLATPAQLCREHDDWAGVIGAFFDQLGRVRGNRAPEEDAQRWGVTADELLDLALRQVKELEEAPEAQGMRAEDGIVFGAMFGESMFTSAHALWVDDGMVAIPNRHALLFHHLKSAAAIGAVEHLITLGREMYEEGPGSISDQLYWKQGDRLTRLPVTHREGGFDFRPPDAFRQVLDGLA